MRKKDENRKNILLKSAQHLLDTEGIGAVTIRNIAKDTNIATGTIYNYFADKEDILLALTENYWEETLQSLQKSVNEKDFLHQMEEVFVFLQKEISTSGRNLMRSLSGSQQESQKRMAFMQLQLELLILSYLKEDGAISELIWSDSFTKEGYATFITQNLILLLRNPKSSPSFFFEIITRTLNK